MDSTGGALLVGMDPTVGQSSMRKEGEERSKPLWMRSDRRLRAEVRRRVLARPEWLGHPSLHSIHEKILMEASIRLAGIQATRRESSLGKEADEELDMMCLLSHVRRRLMVSSYKFQNKHENGQPKVWLASKEKLARRKRAKAKAKKNAKAMAKAAMLLYWDEDYLGKLAERAWLYIQENLVKKNNKTTSSTPWAATNRPPFNPETEDSVTEAVKEAKEVAELVGMDPTGSESSMDQEFGHGPWAVANRPQISPETEDSVTEAVKEAGEVAVLVGMDSSGSESSLDQEFGHGRWAATNRSPISPETEGSVTEAEEAVKEAEEGALMIGMDSTGSESSMRKEAKEREEAWGNGEEPTGPVEFMGNYSSPEYKDQLMEHHQAPVSEAWGSEEPGTEMDEAGKRKLATEEDLPMVGFQLKSEMETEAGKAEEAVVDMNSEGLIGEDAANQLGKRLERIGIRPEMQLCVQEDYVPKGTQRALLDIHEKFAKKKTLRQLVKDLSDKFDMSMRITSAIEENMPMVESDKLSLQPADPSATSSMTRLGVQDDLDHERGKSLATPLAKKTADKEMAFEAKNFDTYRRDWESAWSKTCGSFNYTTVLSSMQFTYYTPGRPKPNRATSTPATLQIFSIKLAEVKGGLGWPLSVYGVVAVRDTVDHNRNLLFSCDRNNSQELTQNDPFLRLIGPSRAVVLTDEVNFEMELKVKGATAYQDKSLITEGCEYHRVFGNGLSTVCFKNCFCTIEFCVQPVRATIQATILGVQVASGEPFPFEYGARVTCSPLPGKWDYSNNRINYLTYPASGEIVMVDSKDGAKLKGSDGYLHLPRNVISVEFQGRLDVDIQSYSKSGEISAKERISFLPKFSKISWRTCCVGGSMVAVTVAWSLVATDKHDLMVLG